MLEVFRTVSQVARTAATVLVLGESGTGKELIARAVHQESQRRDGPFVAINCAALTPTLAESQLFGHTKGAFTGAIASHDGVFRQADGGTLFLDEVAELPLEMQSKLLRALQESTFTPIGANEPVRVDVRIIAATHRDLAHEVREGRFRADLMYRLQVVPLPLPPLRDRRGDIEVLLRHLLARFNASAEAGRRISSLAPAAVRVLLRHKWPGNVRELENVIQHAYAVGAGGCLTVSDLPAELRSQEGPVPSPPVTATPAETADDDEATRIREALARTGGRINEAAKLLGVSRATFFRKRKKHNL
jgi:transcriptional regulator with PAS, ATPase and Fis domain